MESILSFSKVYKAECVLRIKYKQILGEKYTKKKFFLRFDNLNNINSCSCPPFKRLRCCYDQPSKHGKCLFTKQKSEFRWKL